MSDAGSIRLQHDGSTSNVLIDRPSKQNSLTLEMLGELNDALGQIESHAATRVVVLRGAGDKAFSSGADLAAFAEQNRDSAWRHWIPVGHRVFDRLAALPVPTIAALNGNAFGGGLELALACDLRIATSDAKFGLPEVGIGTLPGWGGTHRLVNTVGLARARQMILTGHAVSASTAGDWGLVTECVSAAEFTERVDFYVAALRSKAAVAQGLAKAVLRAVGDTGHNDVLEALAGALTVTTNDLDEGIAAFRAKRPSEFTGT